MKILSVIFLFIFTTSLHAKDARDSVDDIFFKAQIHHINNMEPKEDFSSPDEREQLIKKLEIKGSWKWSFEEWQMLIHGFAPLVPEYYYDEDLKVSNGGIATA